MSCGIVFGFDDSSHAQALDILGVFEGTEKGYELSRIPTRSEALVVIMRLLGKEKDALENISPHPFTDAAGWDEPYISYGYKHAIVQGVSADSFGGSKEVTLKQYCAMLLRVLGYDEINGDFTYENAVSFAALVLGEDIPEEGKFHRGKIAWLTSLALNTRKKGDSITLGQRLVLQGVFSRKLLNDAQRCLEQDDIYSSTTVLIYAIGSDLESKQSRLSNDLEEILLAGAGGNCHVLIQTGGTIKYHNEWMTGREAQRFCVEGNTLKKIDSNINTEAASEETLSEFLRWGVKEAPSKRYILVLWDHGYGVKGGFGADELNQSKTMKISEIKSAIAKANVFFEIIAFDACLMGSVETAFALKDYTRYLIASEEATPACGLYYTTWIGALEQNPSICTERLGRLILDSFTLHAGIEANIPTTLSMMDVKRAQTLVNQISLFTGKVNQTAKQTELLGKNEGIFDQFDLLSVISGVPEITAATQALASEVRNSSNAGQYCGISFYVPAYKPEDGPQMAQEIKDIGFKEDYINVIFCDF